MALDRVLFVRCSPALLAALDAEVARQREAYPGRALARAEVARELLYEGIRERLGAPGEQGNGHRVGATGTAEKV